jgi:hypothetical protein
MPDEQPRGAAAVALLAVCLAPVRSQPQRPVPPPEGAVVFRIIVVESADAARRVLDQLAAGANFVALARQVSVDATASSGGLLGPVALADLRGEVREALQHLRVGELSGIVPLRTGFAILKVVPDQEAQIAPAAASGGAGVAPMASFTTALDASGGVKYVFDVSGYTETVLTLRQRGWPIDGCRALAHLLSASPKSVRHCSGAGREGAFERREPGGDRPDRSCTNLLSQSAAARVRRQDGPAHLIPPEALKSGEDVGRFVDVAQQSGLVSFASAGGVIVDDFDSDGRLDVVTSSLDSCEPLRFFRRVADGLFVEGASKAGLGEQLGGLNILQTDYSNDGHLDILVLRGAWESPQRKSLLRNNGNGTFTDVTAASGLATITATQAAVWVDVDNDGRLDLFVGNENGPAQLFHNTPERLGQYASQWRADPKTWHFLTGTATEVERVCGMFGVDFFADEGLMSHSVRTDVIDRQVILIANVEGNQNTAAQLGDLVGAALSKRN